MRPRAASCWSGPDGGGRLRPDDARRQLPAQRVPRDGRRDDEDVVLVHLQRGPRLLVRRVRRSRPGRRHRRVLPGADRRRALQRRLDDPGARPRRVRGGRRHRPQRPLPRWLPPAGAPAAEAGLPRRRATGLRREPRAPDRDRRQGAGRVRRRRDGRLPGRPAPAAGQAHATRGAKRGRLADPAHEPPHSAQVDLGRPPRDDRLAERREARVHALLERFGDAEIAASLRGPARLLGAPHARRDRGASRTAVTRSRT